MVNHHFNIVLVSPEIPGNTGNVGRTCVALNLRLILIHPLGFSLEEKSVRRAGLDYWKHVHLTQYNSWNDFEKKESPTVDKLFLLTKSASTLHYQGIYTEIATWYSVRKHKACLPHCWNGTHHGATNCPSSHSIFALST